MGFAFDLTPEMAVSAQHNLRDDAEAFLYYGTLGLLDPKMPAEAWVLGGGRAVWAGWSVATLRNTWAMRPTALGFAAGVGRSAMIAFLGAGAIGWFVDPDDRREGGLFDTDRKDWSYHSDIALDAYDW